METLLIVYLLLLLSFILYLIVLKFFNKAVRTNFKNNANTSTTIFTVDELNKIKCDEKKVYCANDSDCINMCAHAIDTDIQTQYKCSEINVCTQSVLNIENTNTSVNCNRENGFFPVLKTDEILQPRWICMNTKPYLFNNNQEFHKYICSGGDRYLLDSDNIFDSCDCTENKLKVRDEFRNNIPLCIDKHQLSLFPNFVRDKQKETK